MSTGVRRSQNGAVTTLERSIDASPFTKADGDATRFVAKIKSLLRPGKKRETRQKSAGVGAKNLMVDYPAHAGRPGRSEQRGTGSTGAFSNSRSTWRVGQWVMQRSGVKNVWDGISD